jgi:hypothetical protein
VPIERVEHDVAERDEAEEHGDRTSALPGEGRIASAQREIVVEGHVVWVSVAETVVGARLAGTDYLKVA